MNLGLTGKNFIVAGSSRGIGAGIAAVLLEEGANVMITGREHSDVDNTFEKFNKQYPGRILSHVGDLNDTGVLQNLYDQVQGKWKTLHGIVANAGAVKPVNDWDIDEADWDWYLSANFSTSVKLVTRFIKELITTKGAIVITGSIAGVEDIGAPLPYSAAKAALTMYAKGLSRKLGADGVRVNTVAPGNIIFPGGNWDKKSKANPEAVNQLLETKVPLKQFGKPDDIGNITAFLLSDKAKFITGSCVVVDGGQTSLFI
ncbi:MAG: SDR family oxidoreductase [Chitinophagaceae bacterium]|nr:MAG: SDR family oxidoreductase [Chitinophagaceae bacterium]